jgi:hypothetical protein
VRDPVDEHPDRDRGDEREHDPEERNPLVGPELGKVRGSQEHAEHHDHDRQRLSRSEPLAPDGDGADDRRGCIGGDDRAHDGDRADCERAVEAEIGERAQSSEEHEPRQVADVHIRERLAGPEDEDRKERDRHEVEPEDDAERPRPARCDRREVVGQAPRQSGREAEDDSHGGHLYPSALASRGSPAREERWP